jgi:hypothetical protein
MASSSLYFTFTGMYFDYAKYVQNSGSFSLHNTCYDNLSAIVNEVGLRALALMMLLPNLSIGTIFATIDLSALTIRVIYEHGYCFPCALVKVYWIFFKIMTLFTIAPLISLISPHLLFERMDMVGYCTKEIARLYAELPSDINTLAAKIGIHTEELPQGWQATCGDWRKQIARELDDPEIYTTVTSRFFTYDTKDAFEEAFEEMLLLHFPEYQVNAAMGRAAVAPNLFFLGMYKAIEEARDQLLQEGYRREDFEAMYGVEYEALKRRIILVLAENSYLAGNQIQIQLGNIKIYLNPARSLYNRYLRDIVLARQGLSGEKMALLKRALNGRGQDDGSLLREGPGKTIFDSICLFMGHGTLDQNIFPGMIQNPQTDFRRLLQAA